MPYQYKPLEDRVLIKPIPPASETMKGLLLSDTAAKSLEGPPLATIVSAGPGKYVNGNFCPMGKDIQAGAIIAYAGAAGTEVPHNGETHLLIQEKEILSVVKRVSADIPAINFPIRIDPRGFPLTPEDAFGPEDAGALGPMHE